MSVTWKNKSTSCFFKKKLKLRQEPTKLKTHTISHIETHSYVYSTLYPELPMNGKKINNKKNLIWDARTRKTIKKNALIWQLPVCMPLSMVTQIRVEK